ncbi:MAG TPA: hypothetical protein VFD32_09265, partial [Dehalococcoidia bacterium]|nr:hypothetical protein [Dehalococcoidia bacterium]
MTQAITAVLSPRTGGAIVAGTTITSSGRKRMRRWYQLVAAFALSVLTLPVAAGEYPERPIRVIVPQGPGGLSDIFMRALADQLGPALGQT